MTTPATATATTTPPGYGLDLLAAALAYAAGGWHVFPLRPGDKRPAFPNHTADRCTGRDPRCRVGHTGWEQRATTDPDRITRAWAARRYGIGIACGPSGLVVIDFDTPKPGDPGPPPPWAVPGVIDGADVFALVCQRAGHPVPITYAVSTGRGGRHLYFTHPATGPALRNTGPGSPNALGWLIDTRAHGGYVVAPPTRVGGNPYRLEDPDAVCGPLPAWIAAALAPKPLPAQQPVNVDLAPGRQGAYLSAAIARSVAAVRDSPAHGHNQALYGAAVSLGQLVAGGALTAEDVSAVLLPAGIGVGQTQSQAAKTIASGIRAGANRPRHLPTDLGAAA